MDKQQTKFNKDSRDTAFFIPPTDKEIIVGNFKGTEIIHSSINVFEEDNRLQNKREMKVKGQDLTIELNSTVLNTLEGQIKSAVAGKEWEQKNFCKVQMVFRDQANFNDLTSDFDVDRKSQEEVRNRKTLFSTCAETVNDDLDVEIPFKYNKTSLESQAKGRNIHCAKLNETSNRWYKTEEALLVDGSYVCNVKSLSYFSIIFTPKKLFLNIMDTSNDGTKVNNSVQQNIAGHNQINKIRKLNVYDKVLTVISIIIGIFTLLIILLFVSAQRLAQKVTAFVNLSISMVLLSYNIVFCFGQLFFSPGPKDTPGCLAVAFFQHFFISSLFTITTG